MKRVFFLALLLVPLAAVLPALSQQPNPDLITLNDATPAIDMVITLPQDSTGTISLNLAQAAVTLTDANDAVVFHAADPRLHGLAFNITPNSGTHTLTVERLPGMAEAYVKVNSLPTMTLTGTVEPVTGSTLTLNQETALTLNTAHPDGSVAVNIPTATTGVISATFTGISANSQLVDRSGTMLAESIGGHIDGLSYVLDAGSYGFGILGSNLTDSVIADVRAVPADESGFTVIDAPATNNAVRNIVVDCTATIIPSTEILRSGPGTGYTLVDYVYRGETFLVGGQNVDNSWIVVGTNRGAAWMPRDAAQMQGSCDALKVFDIPTSDAAPVQIITSPNTNRSDEANEHEAFEHEGHEEHEDNDD
ncbi:MAG: hypothetical protein K8L99_18590 [Anaerolineae bacterium]|nr:hypothetical protein [Anaerolineae bacterium]